MAEFQANYDKVIASEGGYHNGIIGGKVDIGGETYRGIARKFHPNWAGWKTIDSIKKKGAIAYNSNIPEVNSSHYNYAKATFWTPYKLDQLNNQWISNIIFEIMWGFPAPGPAKIRAALGVKSSVNWTDLVRIINKVNQGGAYSKLRTLYAQMLRGSSQYSKFAKAYENRIASWPEQLPKSLLNLFPINLLTGVNLFLLPLTLTLPVWM